MSKYTEYHGLFDDEGVEKVSQGLDLTKTLKVFITLLQ